MLFIEYPSCSTCKKAKKWLNDNRIEYTDRHIVEDNPTVKELREWHVKSGNTNGQLYKELNLKDRLLGMSEEEQYELLASDGMLVKRPIVVDNDKILVGYKETEWEYLK